MKTTKIVNKSTNEGNEGLLYSIDNYKHSINYTTQEIVKKLVSVIIAYMRFISEKITMKNKPYFKFIFERGVETIIHVFSIIFFYTKNLELTFYHSQKAYYVYIEFIEQISDDNVIFLKLSSRDAILFVYKKTIFDLNNDYRKNMIEHTIEEKEILMHLDSYTYLYKNIIAFLINNTDFKYDTKLEYINTCCDLIENINDSLNKYKFKKNTVETIYLFTQILIDKKIDIKEYFGLLDKFFKTINKKKYDENIIKNKIAECDIGEFIDENNITKIVEYIFT